MSGGALAPHATRARIGGTEVVLGLGLALAALIVAFGYVVWFWWTTITFPYSLDYGEGPLLDQAVRLAHRDGIYGVPGADPPWTISNYPPVFPLLDSLGVLAFGPAYWYGRLISAVAALGSAALAGLLVHTITRDRVAAVVTALLVPVIPFVGYWAGLGRVDLLALLLSLAGLWCVVWRPRSTKALALAVILMAAAGLTRQTYLLTAPLTAVCWLWTFGRRRALGFATAMVIVVGVVGAVLDLVTDGGLWFNLVTANVNEFYLSNLTWYVVDLGQRVPILLLLLVGYVIVAARARPASLRLVLPYLAGSLVIGFTAGKSGSSLNYLLELSVALALAAGCLVAALHSRARLRSAALLAVLAQAILLLVFPHPFYTITAGAAHDVAAALAIAALVETTPGPVLADQDSGLLPLAGKPLQLQPFEFSQLSYAGRWDQSSLLRAIGRQQFDLILVYTTADRAFERERWTPEMLAALQRSYAVDHEITRNYGETLIYRPR